MQSFKPNSLHASALVIDTHADTPQRFADEDWDFTAPLGHGMLNLESARSGNLAAEFLAIWVEPTTWKGRFAHRTLTLIDAVHQQIRRHPSELALCTSPAEILAARDAGKFAMLMGIEGGHAIENSLALLRAYFTLGVHYMTLTWANSNDWAESSGDLHPNPADSTISRPYGLTSFGREVVAEMNRLGMMVDVSHASDQTLANVLEATRAPVLASHSCARALCNSPRNLTDDQLRAIATNNGAIMVNFYSAFVDENYRQAYNAQRPERFAAHTRLEEDYATRREPVPFYASNEIDMEFAARIPRPPFESLIAHFEHIVQVAGIDHVGIGSDFDGISALPEGIDSAADLPKITAALAARGFSEADLRKLLGGNLMRVFKEVESLATSE